MSPLDFCEELRTFLRDYLVLAPAMSIWFKQFSLIVVEWFSRVENQNKNNHSLFVWRSYLLLTGSGEIITCSNCGPRL